MSGSGAENMRGTVGGSAKVTPIRLCGFLSLLCAHGVAGAMYKVVVGWVELEMK